nr:deoxyuridine 5'-triphosphate nucleotidohydrolase [Ipomoea batatas]
MAGVMLAPYGFLGQNRPTYSPPFSISSKSTHFHSNSQLHALTVSAMAGNLSSSSADMKASAPSKFVGGAPPYFRVKKLSENAVLPSRGSPLSAGYDLSSAAEIKVPARGKALIPTDLSIAVPEGTYARIAPRSGLAWKHSIDVGAGVIDADYRGAVGVILFNHSDVDFQVKVGDRIAQLIIQNIVTPEVEEVDDLDSTVRGSGGFGSTGV